VLVAALSTLAAGLVLDRAIDRNVTEQIGMTLRRDAGLARDLARAEADLPRTADALADRLGRDLGIRVTVIAADGTVLGDTDLDGEALARIENHAGRPEVIAALRDGEGRSIRYSTTVSDRLLYLALRIDPSDPGRGILRVAVPLTAVREARQELRTQLLKAAILSVLAAAIFGWLLALRPSRRLEEMSRAAGEIASGRLGVRARASRGDDEIGALARSMNRMADQLEERLALLAREHNQLQTVLDGMVEGVLLTGPDGTILLANAAFERIFRAQTPVRGRRPIEAARVPGLHEAFQAALATTEPLTREIALGGADDRVIRASLATIREGGATIGTVAVFHDVTELKRLEQVRREFVANVSHELRTPLTAIKGYAETLRDGGLRDPARAAEFVEVIQRHAERLRDLIEDLLDLAAVEQGEARLALAPTPVRETVAQAEAVIRPAAAARSQTLAIDIPAGLPDALADRDRLAQVLINLLDNAVKFTPERGRVTVSASAAAGRVTLAVGDTGVGIPPADLGRIFERFYRVDRSRDRREGGTGLGLAIAKHLVQAMGGTIEVESRQGSGTTFRVTLPVA
jgi:two-component system, OmpR family, phosphate regulon sensor histidine kinase PhoR